MHHIIVPFGQGKRLHVRKFTIQRKATSKCSPQRQAIQKERGGCIPCDNLISRLHFGCATTGGIRHDTASEREVFPGRIASPSAELVKAVIVRERGLLPDNTMINIQNQQFVMQSEPRDWLIRGVREYETRIL
jgi:hypothetical protein